VTAVVVIGGGPAGLSAAIGFARQGVSTCLVERKSWPVDKACGEGLLPNGVGLLEQLGVSGSELERDGHRVAGIRYYGHSGVTASAEFEHGRAIGLRRVQLSSLLEARARAYPCLEIVTGQSARLRALPGGGFEVGIGDRLLRPRLVVAADGLGSRVAASVGITTETGTERRWGARQHFDGDPWTDHVEVHFARGCEAYITPLAGGVNVAFLWDAARVGVSGGAPVVDALIERLPRLARGLAGRKRVGRPSAAGPFSRRPRERARDGLVLIGDGAGYVDPLTGEGVGLALTQAHLLEELIARPMGQGAAGDLVSHRDLVRFLAAVDRATRSNRQLTRFLLSAASRPRLVDRMIAALARDPELFRHCLAANMGERDAWRVPLLSLLRLPGAFVGVPGWGS
jgi:menaquinone-9 beta-reductase